MNTRLLVLISLSSAWYNLNQAMLKNELALVTKMVSATKSRPILSQKDNAHTPKLFSTSLQQKNKDASEIELLKKSKTEKALLIATAATFAGVSIGVGIEAADHWHLIALQLKHLINPAAPEPASYFAFQGNLVFASLMTGGSAWGAASSIHCLKELKNNTPNTIQEIDKIINKESIK
ncbi:MAG: hypothetical protein ACOYT8_02370 [Candidatus Dependentiae bacterium]